MVRVALPTPKQLFDARGRRVLVAPRFRPFVVDAAVERAEELVSVQMFTSMPADYFNRLIDTLDQADIAPTLARAARRAEKNPQIVFSVTWRVAALDDSHNLSAFSCGNPELDTWLRDHAFQAAGQGSRTFVVDSENIVVGYFAITPHIIDRADAPKKIARGTPRLIPAILLAKLALDQNLQGQG